MIKQTIGENAGTIWQLLDKNTDVPVNKLQELSDFTDKDFYLSIGWLSRENKIYFFEKDKELYICLIE